MCAKIKVAYLIGSLNRGGAETLLLDIFRKREDVPFEMILIHRKGGPYEKEFCRANPKCYNISPRDGLFFSYLLRLRKCIREEHITILHSFFRLDVLLAKLSTIGLNIPIVVTFHGYKGSETNFVRGLFYRLVMKCADKLLFVSKEQMRRYEQRYGAIVKEKGTVLYNGIDFAKLDVTNEVVNELRNERRVRLCMVGNFNSVRSQMVIVKALHKLKVKSEKLKEKIEFFFVGGRYKGEEHYYDECVAYCKEHELDHVHFLGTRDDVPALLKTMDGFVYSSNNDTFGIAVIEAIVTGLPIVVNDHPVMMEVCGEANDGIRYFRTDDAEDAAVQIAEMMANIEQSKQVAAANAIAVRHKYSIENHIDNITNLYTSL